MKQTLYMEVTMDDLQLPLFYAPSARELAKMSKVRSDMIVSHTRQRKPSRRLPTRFIKVEFDDGDHFNDFADGFGTIFDFADAYDLDDVESTGGKER